MKTKITPFFIALALLASLHQAGAQGTAFTYQGQLQDNGSPANNGLYDFQFSLSNAPEGGSQIGGTLTKAAVGVTNGLFAATLDFGSVFASNATWLAISVRTNGVGSYTSLNPLQPLTPAPYAIIANSASNLLGSILPTQLSGAVSLAQLPSAVVTNNEGNVTLDNVTVGGNLTLPGTAATVYFGAQTLLRADGNENFFAGPSAGSATTSGYDNTAVGYAAFERNTTGRGNTANGYVALYANTTGNFNVADGYGALANSATDSELVAIGYQALENDSAANEFATTSGFGENTAIGFQALQINTSGPDNTAVGYLTLNQNTTGDDNTAIGDRALSANTEGSGNTANGSFALAANTLGIENVAIGAYALQGCTNDNFNVAVGVSALQYDNAAGTIYTYSGYGENTAIGHEALSSDTVGSGNTAVGFQALTDNQSGYNNTAVGDLAMISNDNGIENTATGVGALEGNQGGQGNTAHGFLALPDNVNGSYNTANGEYALAASTNGSYNVADGSSSLASLIVGNLNTADGYNSLGSLTKGSDNIAVGPSAGSTLTAGTNNIYIGNLGASAENATIRIGSSQTKTYLVGTVYANGVALTSDRHAKENFTPVDNQAVLAKVAALPVTEWNYKTDSQDVRHIGPMAQDFQAAFRLDGADDKHIAVVDEGGVALAAIQGLNQKLEETRQAVKAKEGEIQTLKRQNDALAERLNGLEASIKRLAAQR